jgi:hypothetical protein
MPAVAAGSGEAVDIASGVIPWVGFTGNTNVVVIVVFAESVAVTLKTTGPVTGGVPVSKPPVLKDNQVGRPVAVQVYGPVPPVAANCSESGMPTVADGSGDVVVMASGAMPEVEFTGNVKVSVTVLFAESVTVRLKVSVPVTGGVPVRVPPVLRDNHVGSPVAVQM